MSLGVLPIITAAKQFEPHPGYGLAVITLAPFALGLLTEQQVAELMDYIESHPDALD